MITNDGMNVRKCDDVDCEFPATHYMVWTAPQYYCLIHINGWLKVADAMSYPIPASTVRKLRIDEMILDDDSEATK